MNFREEERGNEEMTCGVRMQAGMRRECFSLTHRDPLDTMG